MRYTVTLERASNILSAYVPDLSGCVSTGATKEELKANMAKAISLHLDGMIDDGEPIPKASIQYVSSPDQFEVEIGVHHL
jgi:predicted RNase H-like HicB family nuclease